jgi:hypothetical protein
VKEWFGLMFSRNAIIFLLVCFYGLIVWSCRNDATILQKLSDNIQGIIIGYFMGKFSGDSPDEKKKG